MRIRVIGGGWYGSSLALSLKRDGHKVYLHESADRLFAGASGSNPARLHQGQHYPRSHATRKACREHNAEFLARYGFLTRHVPINLYAIAAHDSMVDFENYRQTLREEIEFITVHDPAEYGLQNVEGAILTGERHIVIDEARKYFAEQLKDEVQYGVPVGDLGDPSWDLTLDCTFCALDNHNIDRYEPCVTALVEGPTDKSVTIMDGPFCSLYNWNEDKCLSSLTSAALTPFSKKCKTWMQARALLDEVTVNSANQRCEAMMDQMSHYWPSVREKYRIVGHLLSIRAMPRSGSDARLVDVLRVGPRALRIRAGKIDAILHAEKLVKEIIACA